ncbi:aminotransferase [Anaeramoeba flamelloides]|uniref:L-lysine-epsilon aminotransferase n=1 Tax=Anaeramoeba flamelloides TaxID=1746091 RepID=A0ABQ8YIP2_9EUKA|nr:aminotransferase [Anaeramoeba flamelloides]
MQKLFGSIQKSNLLKTIGTVSSQQVSRSLSRGLTKKEVEKINPKNALDVIRRVMLVDGYNFVVDMDKSYNLNLVDMQSKKGYLDFFSYFASSATGSNHPKLANKEFKEYIGDKAISKISNSDFYTLEMSKFVATFERVCMPKEFTKTFFIAGGALAVENALKAAFDWKVRKNIKAGNGEVGTQCIHFKQAFHGRTGYTMSLTNTSPVKVKYFPKFDWPRITNPKCTYPLEGKNLEKVIELENQAIKEIQEAIDNNPHDIACLIIEPIQGEGGDNHFRPEFMKALRKITEENEILFVCDEVQAGVGITGKMWAYEHHGIVPDMVCFGKKTHVCGVMVTDKLLEVEDNVFEFSSRINSTFGGNYVDMIRAQRILEIIEEENLVEQSRVVGDYLMKKLKEIESLFPQYVKNVRGKGLMCAFDLVNPEIRDKLRNGCYERNMIILPCGDVSLRFRPPLTCKEIHVDEAFEIIVDTLKNL